MKRAAITTADMLERNKRVGQRLVIAVLLLLAGSIGYIIYFKSANS